MKKLPDINLWLPYACAHTHKYLYTHMYKHTHMSYIFTLSKKQLVSISKNSIINTHKSAKEEVTYFIKTLKPTPLTQ